MTNDGRRRLRMIAKATDRFRVQTATSAALITNKLLDYSNRGVTGKGKCRKVEKRRNKSKIFRTRQNYQKCLNNFKTDNEKAR